MCVDNKFNTLDIYLFCIKMWCVMMSFIHKNYIFLSWHRFALLASSTRMVPECALMMAELWAISWHRCEIFYSRLFNKNLILRGHHSFPFELWWFRRLGRSHWQCMVMDNRPEAFSMSQIWYVLFCPWSCKANFRRKALLIVSNNLKAFGEMLFLTNVYFLKPWCFELETKTPRL